MLISFQNFFPIQRYNSKIFQKNYLKNLYFCSDKGLFQTFLQFNSRKKDFWTHQNKINRKTIDFVIFEKQYLKPIIAIEYDWKTHKRSDRQKRDKFVDNVLCSAWIKVFHINHQKNINFEELKNKINELIIPNKNC